MWGVHSHVAIQGLAVCKSVGCIIVIVLYACTARHNVYSLEVVL